MSELRIAVVQWHENDELAEVISHELAQLGHQPTFFQATSRVPEDAEIIFTFAPYGQLTPLIRQLNRIPQNQRPLLVHWNTEGIPDPRIPWTVMKTVGACRSLFDRCWWQLNQAVRSYRLITQILAWLDKRMLRFRYLGDYRYAHRKGILHVFCDSSAVYARFHSKRGLPTVFAPWGSTARWYEDLNLKRDIDVLWMGQRATRRRSRLLDRIRAELESHGIRMYVADNLENPFIFRETRTEILNRAKITLNLKRTWYDDNFSRFALAAPNRSLIVSEPLLPHCPAYQPGVHYVEAHPDRLVERILHYLEFPAERIQIVENAFELTTSALTFSKSIQTILEAVKLVPQLKPSRTSVERPLSSQ